MKTGLNQAAYTVIEVLIVLAVTTGLLVAVMATISGQQGKAEFRQTINDIHAQINEVINNVATGYYANNGSISCSAIGGAPVFSASAVNQGQNRDCVFMGRAMQFSVDGSGDLYNIYDLAGVRLTSGGQQVQTIPQANPRAIAPPSPTNGDTTQRQRLQFQLKAAKMYYTQGALNTPINTVAFMNTVASYSSTGNLLSGSHQVELRPVKTTADISLPATDKSASAAVTAINSPSNLDLIPDGGVTICFNSGTSDQYGLIKIGSNNRQLTTDLKINSGQCP